MIKFLIWFVASFISTFGFVYIYCKLNDIKLKFKLSIFIIYLLGVLFVTLLRYFNISFLSKISYFLFYPLLFYIIKPCKLNRLIYYVFVIWLCGMLFDFSSMLIILLLYYAFKIDTNSLFSVIIPTLYVFLLYITTANIKPFLKNINKFFNFITKIKYADFMLIIFSLFVLALAIILSINIHNLNIGLLITSLAILVVFVFALLLRAKYNEFENSLFIETLRKNNDFYVSMDKEHNIFKHNLIGKLLSVESVANDKARLLLKDLIKEFNSNIDYSEKIEIIPYGLDGIINEKIYPFNNRINIKIDNKIDFDIFDVLKPRRYNVLVEKLSLLLDNAIESCVNSAEKILVINLYEENNQIVLEIKNTFGGLLDVDNIGKINYSTKGKKRGLGLYSIIRNNQVNLNVKVINNMFVAKLGVNINKNID